MCEPLRYVRIEPEADNPPAWIVKLLYAHGETVIRCGDRRDARNLAKAIRARIPIHRRLLYGLLARWRRGKNEKI